MENSVRCIGKSIAISPSISCRCYATSSATRHSEPRRRHRRRSPRRWRAVWDADVGWHRRPRPRQGRSTRLRRRWSRTSKKCSKSSSELNSEFKNKRTTSTRFSLDIKNKSTNTFQSQNHVFLKFWHQIIMHILTSHRITLLHCYYLLHPHIIVTCFNRYLLNHLAKFCSFAVVERLMDSKNS